MALVKLLSLERRNLRQLIKRTHEADLLRRAQAILWLDQGESITVVSSRQGVSRQTVYNWVHRFQERSGDPLILRLQKDLRPGRPPKKGQAIEVLVQQLTDIEALQLGYHSPVWTVAMLRRHLKQTQDIDVSERTIRRKLKDMGYRREKALYELPYCSP